MSIGDERAPDRIQENELGRINGIDVSSIIDQETKDERIRTLGKDLERFERALEESTEALGILEPLATRTIPNLRALEFYTRERTNNQTITEEINKIKTKLEAVQAVQFPEAK